MNQGLSLILAIGLAVLLEVLDNRIKSWEDIERVGGTQVIGTVPSIAALGRRSVAMYVHENPTSPTAEALRVLRTNLGFAAVDASLKSLLIASPMPEEGKTTVMRPLLAKYDTVIFDSPPLLPVTDALLVASLVEGCVIVVRDGHTRRPTLRAGCCLLHQVGAKVFGVVLNDCGKRARAYSDAGSYSYTYAPDPQTAS